MYIIFYTYTDTHVGIFYLIPTHSKLCLADAIHKFQRVKIIQIW